MILGHKRLAIAAAAGVCALLAGCNQPATPKAQTASICGFSTPPPSPTPNAAGTATASDALVMARAFLAAHTEITGNVTCKIQLMPHAGLNTYLDGQPTTDKVWVVVASGGLTLPVSTPPAPPSSSKGPVVTPKPQPVVAVVCFLSTDEPPQLYRISVYRTKLPDDLAAIK